MAKNLNTTVATTTTTGTESKGGNVLALRDTLNYLAHAPRKSRKTQASVETTSEKVTPVNATAAATKKAPKVKAAKPAAEKAPKDPNVLSAPQTRVLAVLAKAKDGLTGNEVAEKAELHPTAVGSVCGYRNPEINDRPVHSRNLLNRDLVRIDKVEGRGYVYVITAKGRKPAGK